MEYIKRYLSLKKLLLEKSYFLLGPRQTGKSSLIEMDLKEFRSYNLLRSDVFQKLSRNPNLLREEIRPDEKIVIIDEIQRLPDLLNEVHLIIEEKKIHFLLTGSSARKLRKAGVNLLGGRARTRYLHPFVSYELKDKFDLKRAFINGLIPGIYFSSSPDEDLDAYIGNYLEQEILAEGITRQLPSFARALEVASFCHGEQINYTNLASDAQLSRSTLQNYFQVLIDTLIIYEVPCWGKSKKRKAQTTSKYYFFDFGLVRRLQRIKDIPEQSIIFGKAFESILFQEIKAYCDYHLIKDLHYWRTQDKTEVDFIIDNKIAIEIKASPLVQDRHLKGLLKLKEEKILNRYLVVSLDETYRRSSLDPKIEIYPWKLFLRELWDDKIK